MTNLLVRIFVKDYDKTGKPAVRGRYGLLAGFVGLACNVLLFSLKFLVGMVFGSIAIIADAVNNLSDAGSCIVTLIGFKMSGKPADEEHPYGHARVEYIAGLVVSFSILLLGIQLIGSSVQKIFKPEAVEFSWLSVAVLGMAILVKLWMGLFYRKVGKTIDSMAILANSADSMNDVYATSAVLVSALVGKVTGWQLDGYAGTLVAIFIIISGIGLVRETLNPLLGTAPTQELVNKIEDKLHGYEGVLGTHDLMVHNYGPQRCFASVHVEVCAKEDILKSHDMIDNIEKDFAEDLDIHLVIHLDPVVTDDEETNHMRDVMQKILQKLDSRLSMHDFRMVKGNTHSNLIFDVAVPPRYQMSDKELREVIDMQVKADYPDYFTVITVDRSYTSTTGRADSDNS
ncbi:MAG: cation transporter [Clostridia bacterium]|nr:cation transporter [Clostridia bacterium]